jgi:(p)ppGpp synthase/HD superfamily hydrolase
MKAQIFAMAAHAAVGQTRKYSGLPYHVHPEQVRQLLLDHVPYVSQSMLDAASLHDVLEDTDVPAWMIEHEFGPEVARLVQGMTKREWNTKPAPPREFRFRSEVARLARCCPTVKTIKLADSYANMLDYVKDDVEYAKKVYLPEKRILLDEALKEGDKTLWNMCDQLINENLR